MTTATSRAFDEGASGGFGDALDPFRPSRFDGLRALLPRLARPSWVRLIGEQRPRRAPSLTPAPISVSPEQDAWRHRRAASKKAKRPRFLRALLGEHTRVHRPAE